MILKLICQTLYLIILLLINECELFNLGFIVL